MALNKTLWTSVGIGAVTTIAILAQNLISDEIANDEVTLVAERTPAGESVPNSQPKKQAEPVAAATPRPKPTPSENVTINLINRLVQRGVLTQEDADELIKQAEDDAAKARALAVKERTQPAREEEDTSQIFAEPTPLPLTSANVAQANPPPPAEGPAASSDEEAVDVSYVPEIVKRQLREEIKEEVMKQARDENWANPNVFPSWASRITPFFDFRIRYEGIFYPGGNDNTGAFPNFNAINTGPPFDTTGAVFSPQLNVDRDRERFRLRLRLGAEMDLGDGFTAGFRIATGETDTPVSPNQSLGLANNGQGGDFSKYAVWLDRGFVRYEVGGKPSEDFQVTIGRFDNPFFTTSGIIWYEDLGFDGLAISGRYRVADGVTPFAVVGGFPVFNTELNFASNRPDKFSSEDKYLAAGQLGVNLRFNKDFSAKVAGAFYDFENVEGKLSSGFVPLTSSDQGNTDDSRPSFAQNGNTYFPIRRIIPTVDNNFGTKDQFQFFGLATPFREANFTGALDYAHFDPFHLKLYGEYVENIAFDWQDINSKAVNNRGPNLPSGKPGHFAGGNSGWIVGLKAGSPALEKRWDWNVGINYRYVESDATIDGFVDSDFAGNFAGTNLKGYTVFGSLALTPRTSLFLRFMSADSIAGPTFRNDVIQFDLNAAF